MKAIKIIYSTLALLIVSPIWYYLMYVVLKGVHANELQMFLFWVYIPVSLLTNILMKVVETSKD